MRHPHYLQSEHISMIASELLWRSGLTVEQAIETAIKLQLEAAKQCDHLNDLADRLAQG